ncbi:helix-turn-helix domain-containing protein [Luteipulveratus sp. YIM 133132]|uniref:helix-turn-helix domain-containing protein n=1 Tax=Luteipulveratus flavus TaxID=3031728 RepID=UPI0023B1A454|nr:helix-turn-helix domain-containing protein [Luteipulveratus sp. YIM 133132]MDE9365683.1 helix-turn-helix domain-containing protein [Luteipulveratus sp. YIM 133132]
MSAPSRLAESETYVPGADEQGRLLDLVAALSSRGARVEPQPALVTADNTRHELTPGLADLLAQIVQALAQGQGVSVIPRQRLLTTQEAADLLNVSRPTLIKRLEAGDLAYEMRGRHRRIRLDELLAYQERLRVQRSDALDAMQQQAQEDGLYDLLDGPPPATR